jgi:eukaryotic-like serine/threonine-protein kinase
MSSALAPGTIIDRYRVLGMIGAGSMGDVVRGVDFDLNRPVAIKILSDRHRENEELRARFVREARAVAAIAHPNVVQVFTTGTHDQRPYIAMELLDGVDLGSVVKQHGVMTSVQAARATLDAARGLQAAAQAGLIHRDVKPTNLVLLSSGVVKVTDFGLAKPLDPSNEPALTAMGVVVGTPDYIAPEQARGETIDERVDIYALGGTLYYLLTGDPPFRTGNPAEDKYLKVVARHLKEPAPDPRSKNPGADAELAALCRRTMSKKPGERPGYPDLIRQLSAVIDRLHAGGSSSLPAVSAASERAAPEPTPYVAGRAGPRAADVAAAEAEDAAATLVRRPASIAAEHGDPAWAHGRHGRDGRDGAPHATAVAAGEPCPPDGLDGDRPVPVARWLIGVTVVSALVFFTGLGLMLFGPRPDSEARGADAADAGVRRDLPARRPDPTPPEGMLLVRRQNGAPWLFVARAPVSAGQFAEAHPDEPDRPEPRNKRQAAQPVVSVSYADAESFAAGRGMRLPTPDEWAAAAATEGFEPAGKTLWEWVDDGTRGVQALRAVRGQPERADRMRPVAHANVSFRLARDL